MSELPQIIATAKDLALAVSAIAAIYLGFRSFTQWRKQTVWQSRFEIARRIMQAARRFQAQLAAARSAGSHSGESTDRPRDLNETEAEIQRKDERYARMQRLIPLQETLQELYQAFWEAELVMGEDLTQLIQPLQQAFTDLRVAITMHFSDQLQALKRESREELINTK